MQCVFLVSVFSQQHNGGFPYGIGREYGQGKQGCDAEILHCQRDTADYIASEVDDNQLNQRDHGHDDEKCGVFPDI